MKEIYFFSFLFLCERKCDASFLGELWRLNEESYLSRMEPGTQEVHNKGLWTMNTSYRLPSKREVLSSNHTQTTHTKKKPNKYIVRAIALTCQFPHQLITCWWEFGCCSLFIIIVTFPSLSKLLPCIYRAFPGHPPSVEEGAALPSVL
jgi:hypothetical protein